MANLFVSLMSTTSALRAFERSLATVQNNVTNASTPGYVKQRQVLNAASFQPERGIVGGVTIGERQSARNEYTEQMVCRQQNALGKSQQLKASLSEIEPMFDVTGDSGIPKALSELFGCFSELSVAPNDAVARQSVIDQAGHVANAFQSMAFSLDGAAANAGQGIRSTVDSINRLAGLIRGYNAQIRSDVAYANDPAVDAGIHATLEDLSELVDVQIIKQADGSYNLLMAGQTALVVGDRQYMISADTSTPKARILNSSGAEVTGQIHTGRLGAQLELSNEMLPGWRASLDQLASTVATNINNQLAAGDDLNGTAGAALFSFVTGDAARTLAVTNITPSEIAAAADGVAGGNGNALTLAAMGRSAQVGTFTFSGFYAEMAADFGRDLDVAKQDQTTAKQLLLQARAIREEQCAVSLDEEAAMLLQFQHSYEAAARLATVLDDMTKEIINLIR